MRSFLDQSRKRENRAGFSAFAGPAIAVHPPGSERDFVIAPRVTNTKVVCYNLAQDK
ncbi:hypothetical protein KL86PLE_130664 [uncultured Pleomorphomonas sp.]|uniref:Uncharacterized protein n=1 Tax=uncultured Pleomorphomonas sp. TaxID=442121 RepID=A0A212LCG5_9HYPH|nr:hypothetical protein KL86PLE_130664 [uncultured Pleomorphomonas sp.]